MMDFSTAGYMGGGVALPMVPVKRTVQPSGNEDDTDAIQAAVNEVAALPLVDGFRGAVLLAPGVFTCSRTINLQTSGVVLRGSGSGSGGTTIRMTGGRHSAFAIGGGRGQGGGAAARDDDDEPPALAAPARETQVASSVITDAYVPAGTKVFTLESVDGFAVGDIISIRRPTTAAWIKLVEMDTLRRVGRPQTWLGEGRNLVMERTITAINGNRVTVDISLADSLDAKYLNPPGTRVSKIRPASATRQVGVEHLHLQCPPLETSYGQAPYSGFRIDGEDCWVKDVYCEELMNTSVLRGKRITMQEVVIKHTYPNLGASKPTDFSIEGTQMLLDRCRVTGDNTYFVWTGSLAPGPNVLLNCVFNGHGSRIQPHMRWSTGMLVDNCKVPEGGIDFPNRGVAGSGHGWTMGWAVAWTSLAKFYVIQNPPGAANWAIGCIGDRELTARYFDVEPILPEGIFDSHGTPVAPQSLYLAQLQDRLGPAAVRSIGYASNTERAFNQRVPRLPDLRRDVDPVFGPDLAMHRPVNANGMRDRQRAFAGEKALDGDAKTYWALGDGVARGSLEVDMEGPVELNAFVIEEAPDLTGRVQSFRVEGMVGSDWILLGEGTTVGERKAMEFPNATLWKVRLMIGQSEGYPAIRKFGLYRKR
jgi:hypothetical protein